MENNYHFFQKRQEQQKNQSKTTQQSLTHVNDYFQDIKISYCYHIKKLKGYHECSKHCLANLVISIQSFL